MSTPDDEGRGFEDRASSAAPGDRFDDARARAAKALLVTLDELVATDVAIRDLMVISCIRRWTSCEFGRYLEVRQRQDQLRRRYMAALARHDDLRRRTWQTLTGPAPLVERRRISPRA